MMSNVIPIYLRPTRNAYGILGGIPQSEFKHETIEKRVKETPNATWPVHAVVTNSTYDGLFYNCLLYTSCSSSPSSVLRQPACFLLQPVLPGRLSASSFRFWCRLHMLWILQWSLLCWVRCWPVQSLAITLRPSQILQCFRPPVQAVR